MATYAYASKTDLKEEIHKRYLLLDGEYNDIDDSQKDIRLPEVDRTPAEIIAYQLGWLNLVMSWDKNEKEGEVVQMPSPDYKWNQLGELYQSFYKNYSDCTLTELRHLFRDLEKKWLDWIDNVSDDELYTQGVHTWTGDNPNWPMIRWIHINSVAPFTSFRAKIRKWKKNHAKVNLLP
ncbi:ClbS/DfsB family four-helix bundle protein [Paenibacillus sp. OSY-SE]|uniref:ClbS/DfsB family four-helix bundle protein n=1 Tax=Paenibacillus sp. OSY-SE TaxID=1196323 RepID=UPI0002D5F466|nr:ClbS/DfsB family four-helix bundle protein [Paenibacillus sp. OSY-SE]